MSSYHPTRWIAFFLASALSALGCVASTDAPQGETGSLSVNLVLADGLEIDEVGWQITGNGMDMSGDIEVSAPGSTASVEVFGLPPGAMDYTVTLTATTTDEAVSCQGSAPFNVEVGQTTDVMVMLNCKKPRTLGGVRVNGKFNICTQLTKTTAAPLETSVGNDISLSAQAFDEEGDAISYSWTGDGGSIADPTAASTTYTCQDVGDHTVTIMVTDNDVYCRMATWTIPVTCVPGDGGDLCEDVECEDDGNECTVSECNPANGLCETSNVADGTECDGGAGTCSGGQCVEVDLCEGVDCNDDLECTADACDPANGTCSNSNVENGTPCADDTGMCVDGSCMVGNLCDGVVCDDTGNECTVAMCNTTTGVCETMNVTDGTECNGGAGACSAGVCIDNNPCQGVDCTSDNDCVQDGTCDPADGLCDPGDPQPADTACDLAGTDDGFCDGTGACVACNADAQCPDDGNECTAETCTSNACSSSPVADGTACDADGSAGVCMSGVCEDAMLCADAETRCSDGNECTQDLCDPATGNCSNPAEPDGSQCTCPVCGAEGVCDMGVCIDPCDGVDCSDGNQCTADLCNVGVCSNPNVGPGAACDQDGGNVCDGAGICVECNDANDCDAGETCEGGVCEAPALATCDPTGQGAVVPCQTLSVLAVDCTIFSSGVPVPLDPSVVPSAAAFAGVELDVQPQATITLPADLTCGFSGVIPTATVFDSEVDFSFGPDSLTTNSFLDPNDPLGGANPISPHDGVSFNFFETCGTACDPGTNTCQNDSSIACNVATQGVDCVALEGTGPGLVAPFFPRGATPTEMGSVAITPGAPGAILFTYAYDGIVMPVDNVQAPLCIGGKCNFLGFINCPPADRTGPSEANGGPAGDPGICRPVGPGQVPTDCTANDAPRIMYDAACNKLGAQAETCEPFEEYNGVANVCAAGQPGTALADTDAPTLCGNCVPEGCVGDPSNPDIGTCRNGPDDGEDCATNADCTADPDPEVEVLCRIACTSCDQQDCCDYLQSRYLTATPAQFPALPVNPAP